jgi:hypothetical protein
MSVRRTETWKIVEDLVNSMSFELSGVGAWVDNLNGTYTLNLCKTYWLETQTEIVVDSVTYTVTSVVNDDSITVSGTSIPTLTTFNIDAPVFYSGTIVQTNQELGQDTPDVEARTPMAYLFRDIEDTFLSLDSMLERETPIRLFFLDDEDFADFSSRSNSTELLEPMRQMAYYFVDEVLKNSTQIGRIEDNYSIRDYSKFGTEDANGYVNNIFNDQLSGVELSITLPIKPDYRCEC